MRVFAETNEKAVLVLVTVCGTVVLQKSFSLFKEIGRKGLKQVLITFLSRFLRNFRAVEAKINQEHAKTKASFKLTFDALTHDPITVLPDKPLPNVIEVITQRAKADAVHRVDNRLSGSLYHGGDQLSEIANQAMRMYTFANPLHPDIFPSIRQMECEIVQMTLNLFHGDEESCGVVTSGGTESLLLAVLAYRELGKSLGITEVEIVLPETVHPAVSKAAFYFGVHLVKVKVDKTTGEVSVKDIARNIGRNTVAIFASAPGYPHGIIDPIEELGRLALKYRVKFHVDACLGGFLIPFVEAAGFPVPICDFRVKGVTSISCDLHKYGYTPKGISVLMYANEKLRRCQYFSCADWPGGLYLTPCTSGSRPGVLSAGAWAVLMSMGKEGYLACATEIMAAANYIRENSKMPDIEIIGSPCLSIVAFTSKTLNPHAIGAEIKKIGRWDLNHLQNPDGFHMCVTYANAGQAKEFVKHLEMAVENVRKDPGANSSVVALYGMVASVPDKSIVGEISLNYADFLFSLK